MAGTEGVERQGHFEALPSVQDLWDRPLNYIHFK